MASPRRLSSSTTFTVPSPEGPSSSDVMRRATEPLCEGCAATKRSQAVTKAATEVFMSAAPRPYRQPSRTVGTKGSECHFSSGPEGTTSVWPASTTSGLAVPWRIQRLVTSPCTMVSALKPSGTRRSMITCWHPSSAGVMDLRAISALASSSVSFFKGDLPGEELPVHDPVAEQAVERVPEGRGPVLLEAEVADPREAVARERDRE